MSASLRSLKPADARRPASGSGRIAVSERYPAAHSRRRGVAGLVAVCVLALGVAACSVRDAKAEASASASASASAVLPGQRRASLTPTRVRPPPAKRL